MQRVCFALCPWVPPSEMWKSYRKMCSALCCSDGSRCGVPHWPSRGFRGTVPPSAKPSGQQAGSKPTWGRTPGSGNFRTPFSYELQSSLSQSHSSSSDSHVPSQLAVSAEVSSGEAATAGVMTVLEAVSVADKRRLSPIMTHVVLSPSDVSLCSKEPGCRADCRYPFSDD